MSLNECTHTIRVRGEWVPNPFHNPAEWECNGFDSGPETYIDAYDSDAYIIIGYNKIQCSLCGHIIETNKPKQSC